MDVGVSKREARAGKDFSNEVLELRKSKVVGIVTPPQTCTVFHLFHTNNSLASAFNENDYWDFTICLFLDCDGVWLTAFKASPG